MTRAEQEAFEKWMKEINQLRNGRKSWIAPKKMIDKLPVTISSSDVYVDRERIGRRS